MSKIQEDNMDFTSASHVYDLEQPRYSGAPVHPSHAPGLIYTLHRRHEQGASEARTSASGFVYMAEHSGTHIDALCHQAEGMHLYGVQEVGVDNVAWDEVGVVDPDLKVSLPGHLILLVRHGIYIIENLNLEELARDRCYEFTFICLPLKIQGATGSPVRPIAVVPVS